MKLLLVLLVLAGTFCGGLYVGQHPDAPQLRQAIDRFSYWLNDAGDAVAERAGPAERPRE
jgi:hypothetical protein